MEKSIDSGNTINCKKYTYNVKVIVFITNSNLPFSKNCVTMYFSKINNVSKVFLIILFHTFFLWCSSDIVPLTFFTKNNMI